MTHSLMRGHCLTIMFIIRKHSLLPLKTKFNGNTSRQASSLELPGVKEKLDQDWLAFKSAINLINDKFSKIR